VTRKRHSGTLLCPLNLVAIIRPGIDELVSVITSSGIEQVQDVRLFGIAFFTPYSLRYTETSRDSSPADAEEPVTFLSSVKRRPQSTRLITGSFQLLSRIAFSGPYVLMIGQKGPSGAGSQLLSLSLPGVLACM
jgi:hypothetical protein